MEEIEALIGGLVIASLAVAAGLDERTGPFVALYVLVLAVLGPLMAACSAVLARLLPAQFFPPVPERQAIPIPEAPDGCARRPMDSPARTGRRVRPLLAA